MDDPFFDAAHLPSSRRAGYRDARAAVRDGMGGATMAAEAEVWLLGRPGLTPTGYGLLDRKTGRVYPLRVGANSVGRFDDCDIVFRDHPISRRHCVVVVHATGGCEVIDTASRNGTRVNREVVAGSPLAPGDELQLCGRRLVLLELPPGGADTARGDGEPDNPYADRTPG